MSEASIPVTVLYVDDEPDSAETIAAGLEREYERLRVETAESVAEGLERFAEGDLDCIVSDYQMAGQNGLDFLQVVRADDPDFPFLFYTQTGDERVASEAVSAGVTDYIIQHPIDSQSELLGRRILAYVEKHRADRRLARTQQHLRDIANATDDVLWIFSPDWTELKFINDAYEEVFGAPVESVEANPKSFLERVHPDDVDRVETAMERASEGEAQQLAYRVRQSEEIQLWVESQCIPVFEADGGVKYVVGSTRDITDSMTRELDLLQTNERLEEFASLVAHDLRNPLGVASGRLELAREEHDSDHLTIVSRALTRINNLIDDLLTLAREGTATVEKRPANLETLAETSADTVVMVDSTLTVDADIQIQCDPVRVRELFENLYRNAIEHGGGDVSIAVGPIDRDGKSGFYVEDDGPGIPESERERVFERGYSTNRSGTGFGLAIVELIAESHGWQVAVTEGETGGARFEITGVEFA